MLSCCFHVDIGHGRCLLALAVWLVMAGACCVLRATCCVPLLGVGFEVEGTAACAMCACEPRAQSTEHKPRATCFMADDGGLYRVTVFGCWLWLLVVVGLEC
jgi:hypothetical protein